MTSKSDKHTENIQRIDTQQKGTPKENNCHYKTGTMETQYSNQEILRRM